MRLPAPLVIMPLLFATHAGAQELPGNPEAGRQLARRVCSVCHVVEQGQADVPNVGAPPFAEVAKDLSITALSLRVFLQTPHERMPDLMLAPQETDDVISYILTLKRR